MRKFDKLTYKVDNLDSELDSDEINEHKALFSFNNNNYQFLFCGNNGVALAGQRFIVLINKQNEITSFKVIEEKSMEALAGGTLFKCITEIEAYFYSMSAVYKGHLQQLIEEKISEKKMI